jgi:FKBP-type peptidyl-prolyl cis-trans isomerase
VGTLSLGLGALGSWGCSGREPPAVEAPIVEPAEPSRVEPAPLRPNVEEPEPEMTLTEHGVGVIELRAGSGPAAAAGDSLEVHYVGRLDSGKEFDSSRARNASFTFELGGGRVIDGWEEGLAGMRVGEIRRLIIPPSMGYGARGVGAVPPNAILEFDMELLSLTPHRP